MIYCSVSGFGSDGPYKKRAGYDVIAASLGGLMHITGPEVKLLYLKGHWPVCKPFLGLYRYIKIILSNLELYSRVGGGIVVSALAFYSDNPSTNPAEATLFCKISFEKNKKTKRGWPIKYFYSDMPRYFFAFVALGVRKTSTNKNYQDGAPCKVGVAMTDLATGLYAHGAIMAALLERQKTGMGQKIDCNLLATQVHTFSTIYVTAP